MTISLPTYLARIVGTFIITIFTQMTIASDSHISIKQAVVNPTVSGMPVTAAYMTINNHGKEAVRLIKAKGKISGRIELHEHTMKDGLMKMQQVSEGIVIEANSETVLKPGGYHIMIMDLTSAVEEGSVIDLTLVFDNGTEHIIQATATKPSAKSHHGSHSHHHKKHKHH